MRVHTESRIWTGGLRLSSLQCSSHHVLFHACAYSCIFLLNYKITCFVASSEKKSEVVKQRPCRLSQDEVPQ